MTSPSPAPEPRAHLEGRLRVCVVGGGAAGLAAAHEAHLRGHHVVVFERSDRIGGKVRTRREGGALVEMGAAAWMPSPALPQLAREVGLAWKTRSYAPWVEEMPVADGPHATRNPLAVGNVLTHARGLSRLAAALLGLRRAARTPGLAHWPKATFEALDGWLTAHHVDAWPRELTLALACGMTSGYPEDALPACYCLPNLLKLLSRPGPLLARTFEAPIGGFESILTAVARQLDVRTSTPVERVTRGRGVTVHVAGETLRFDAIVVTCPLDHALGILDASPVEVDIFTRIRHLRMRKVLCEVTPAKPAVGVLLVGNARSRARIGHPVAFLVGDRSSPQLRSFYQYADLASSPADLDRAILDYVAQQGGSARLLDTCDFAYETPHFATDDLHAGVLRRLEDIQGERATYFAGEVVAGAGLTLAIEYARSLIARNLPG